MSVALLDFWSADDWNAFGNVLLGIGAVSAGLWSLFNYRKNRRAEAARWLQGVFRDFYLDSRFNEIKQVMEYKYSDLLAPLLERRITDPRVPISEQERLLLDQLDMLLNYFEHVIYLQHEGHFDKQDRQAVFEYWFDLLAAPERAAVRRYSSWFGFERIAHELKCREVDYVAFYGSLMEKGVIADKPNLRGQLRRIGPATLEGELIDLGEYPGLIPGKDAVVAELYEVVDHEAFRVMDEFERYEASDHSGSLFVRRLVRLSDPDLDAWVYAYNRDASGKPRISGGDWLAQAGSLAR